jgi:chorismate mutase
MTKTDPQAVADAIREVTARMQDALEGGRRSSRLDAEDLVEVLLAIADRLDPPLPAAEADGQ